MSRRPESQHERRSGGGHGAVHSETAAIFAGATLFLGPLFSAIVAGILLMIFSPDGWRRHVQAGLLRCRALGVVSSLSGLFSAGLIMIGAPPTGPNPPGANLGIFVPMLDETSFVTQFLSAIDLVLVWWVVTCQLALRFSTSAAQVGSRSRCSVCTCCSHSSSATPGRVPEETRCPGKRFPSLLGCAGSRRGCGGQPVLPPRDGPERQRRGPPARDLEAIVSASGKIQPKRQVNVSANTTGRVTRVAVEEGQRVKTGQFLLEIDPRSLDAQLQRGEASVAAAQSSLQQSRAACSRRAPRSISHGRI